MYSVLPNTYGRQLLNLFADIAGTITYEYIEDISTQIDETGIKPSFEELMNKVRSLNHELNNRAVWIKEDYKIGRGRKSARLTRGCKKMINRSVDDFLRTVKVITYTHKNTYAREREKTIPSLFY